jgi:hypothetical protein
VLASLAMLALKGALRVAPGGSAPLFPSAPPHGLAFSGRDEKAGSSAEPESWIAVVRPGGRGDIPILENQGTILFCVDTGGSKSVSTPPTDGVFYAPNHSDQPCRHGQACSGIERPAVSIHRSHECQVRQDKFLEPLEAQFRRNLLPARTFRHFRPQKGERVSNQALGPEFSDSNTLPVEPTWPKTRNE